MKYIVCDTCGYSYFLPHGDESSGILPFTPLSEIPHDFVCPMCRGPSSDFVEISPEIHLPIDKNDLLDIEFEHIAFYSYTHHTFTYSIGNEDQFHPSDDDHKIECLFITDEDSEIIHTIPIPSVGIPVTFDFDFDISYKVYTFCGIHGIWEGIHLQ